MRILSSFAILLMAVFASNCCSSDDEPDPTEVALEYVTANGSRLFSSGSYHLDSVEVLNEFMQLEYIEKRSSFIVLGPEVLLKDAAAFNDEVCESFIIRFTPTDSDSIRFCFMRKTDHCDLELFSYMKIFYNDSLILIRVTPVDIGLA
jgi:hypothetical protein